MSKEQVTTLHKKCTDCDRHPRYASAVGCWNRDFVCNCTEGNMLIHGRRVHRIHIGRYEDFIGRLPRKDTDDPEVADSLPPKDDDENQYAML